MNDRQTTRRIGLMLIEMPALRRRERAAFTLIEMVVVIALIALLLATALPSVTRLYSEGSDEQAYNLFSAQLTAARTLAIREGTYAAVHCQIADATDELLAKKTAYSAVLIYAGEQDGAAAFKLADGFTPQPLPGHYTFGDVDELTRSDRAWDMENNRFKDFRGTDTFARKLTIVFDSEGRLVTTVDGRDEVRLLDADENPILKGENDDGNPLWTVQAGCGYPRARDEPPTTSVVLFDYAWFEQLPNHPNAFLDFNERAQFLAINPYTGQLYPRK